MFSRGFVPVCSVAFQANAGPDVSLSQASNPSPAEASITRTAPPPALFVQVSQIGQTIRVMQRTCTFARFLAMQLPQVGQPVAVVHAALLDMPIVAVVHLMVQRFPMLLVVYRALVARAFPRADTLNLCRVGDRHLWRLIATKYLRFFFRHDSPQQNLTSAPCRQQGCLQ